MTLPEIEARVARISPLLEFVDNGKLLGRMSANTGRVEQLDADFLRSHLEEWSNALRDVDGEPLLDLDNEPLYEPGAILDNPTVPVHAFDTVTEMVAYPEPNRLDRCITLNWSDSEGRGILLHWVMVASEDLAENGDSVLDSFNSYGRFVRVSQA